MNTILTSMGLIAGTLQLIVAAYALRLNRRFGTARVGWSLFGAFSLMALLHLVQAATPFNAGEGSGIKVEVMYSLIALLLFVSMVHLETLLKERMDTEMKERQMRAELEAEVKRKTAYLMRANEQLQAEMDERKRMDAEVECLDFIRPRLFDCFADMIAEIPATAIIRVLARESYMLEVDLANQRPLLPVEVGSILIFSRFVGAVGQGARLSAAVVLPPAHVAFYQRTVGRLIEAGELSPTAMDEFERVFAEQTNEWHGGQVLVPKLIHGGQISQLTALAKC
jgi:hypothetical protein